MDKALFIDLDGTLITTNSGRKFPIHSNDWKLLPNTLEAIKYFYSKGYKIIIVSNQGGISEGYLAEKVFISKIEAVCAKIEKLIKLKENTIAYFYCKDMESYNRKPNPGMAYEAAMEYELNLSESVMFGDLESDKGFQVNSGIGEHYHITEINNIDWNSK
jgi:HAD superfamily hydrolase (TIGR01662 family)